VTKSEAARSLTIAILHNIITGYTQARSALLKPLKDYRDSLEEPARPHQRRARYDDPAYIRRSGSCADDPAITPLVMASVGDTAPFMPTAWRSYAASGRSAVGAETMSSASRIARLRITPCGRLKAIQIDHAGKGLADKNNSGPLASLVSNIAQTRRWRAS
jgi:hypothetical protein